MPVLSVDVTVSSESAAAAPVRKVARLAWSILRRAVDPELMALLTTELVSNAVRLDAGPVLVTFSTSAPDRVRVEVHDRSHARPRLRRPGPLEGGGARGLLIVAELADAWGVDDAPVGKVVWFELAARREAG